MALHPLIKDTVTTDTSGSSFYLYQEGSMPLSTEAVQKLTQPTQSSSLLLIKIVSSAKDAPFTLPVLLVTQRELKIQAASSKFGIPPERWSRSLLYKAFQEQGHMEIVLMPEKECTDQNYSHCFRWEPWLTDLVQLYYQTGQFEIGGARRLPRVGSSTATGTLWNDLSAQPIDF
jgi:hypothetical protein